MDHISVLTGEAFVSVWAVRKKKEVVISEDLASSLSPALWFNRNTCASFVLGHISDGFSWNVSEAEDLRRLHLRQSSGVTNDLSNELFLFIFFNETCNFGRLLSDFFQSRPRVPTMSLSKRFNWTLKHCFDSDAGFSTKTLLCAHVPFDSPLLSVLAALVQMELLFI